LLDRDQTSSILAKPVEIKLEENQEVKVHEKVETNSQHPNSEDENIRRTVRPRTPSVKSLRSAHQRRPSPMPRPRSIVNTCSSSRESLGSSHSVRGDVSGNSVAGWAPKTAPIEEQLSSSGGHSEDDDDENYDLG
jgi:hypothetical protein